MKASKVKQESQKTAWDCPFLEVSWKVIPLPGMWPLSPTPNLLSKCHQALAKDKGKGHRESLRIHLPLSAPWMDYSGLIRPVYLLPCRNRRTKKEKKTTEGNYLLLHNAWGDSAGHQRALMYIHTCRQSQRRALMPCVKKQRTEEENCKRMRKGWSFLAWPNGFCLLHFAASQKSSEAASVCCLEV